jgi:hypothetical protein
MASSSALPFEHAVPLDIHQTQINFVPHHGSDVSPTPKRGTLQVLASGDTGTREDSRVNCKKYTFRAVNTAAIETTGRF